MPCDVAITTVLRLDGTTSGDEEKASALAADGLHDCGTATALVSIAHL
jgi:hypothetical protein